MKNNYSGSGSDSSSDTFGVLPPANSRPWFVLGEVECGVWCVVNIGLATLLPSLSY